MSPSLVFYYSDVIYSVRFGGSGVWAPPNGVLCSGPPGCSGGVGQALVPSESRLDKGLLRALQGCGAPLRTVGEPRLFSAQDSTHAERS